ncbi:MAG: nitrate/nitrite transporter NrtS [Trichormus sp.]
MKAIREYCLCLGNRKMMPTALKVAVVVGSILFTINHGAALIKGHMTSDRWIAATLTYIVPYLVNIHGQYISRYK